MLILARREYEEIVIDTGTEKITLTVLEAEYGKVRLGFTAPKYIRIDRKEVAERREAEGS